MVAASFLVEHAWRANLHITSQLLELLSTFPRVNFRTPKPPISGLYLGGGEGVACLGSCPQVFTFQGSQTHYKPPTLETVNLSHQLRLLHQLRVEVVVTSLAGKMEERTRRRVVLPPSRRRKFVLEPASEYAAWAVDRLLRLHYVPPIAWVAVPVALLQEV